jgi:hypothetical protein
MLMSKGFSQINALYTEKLSSSISLLGMPQNQNVQGVFKVGYTFDHLRIAEDVVIYAHHADDYDGSIDEQIKYLEIYNTWRTCWIPQPPSIMANFKDNNWLVGSTILVREEYLG